MLSVDMVVQQTPLQETTGLTMVSMKKDPMIFLNGINFSVVEIQYQEEIQEPEKAFHKQHLASVRELSTWVLQKLQILATISLLLVN